MAFYHSARNYWVYPFLNFNIGPIAAVWFRDFLGKKYGSGDKKQDVEMQQASI
nr:7846_t:CDS:2 [Entrophospora candida]